MRRTTLFAETLRENPADTEMVSHQLLLRAGFIQPLATGIYSYLPLGERVKNKVEWIMREEMDAIDGQQVSLPVVQPAELWQETGRWYDIGSELVRFRDRTDRDMVLAMTHEEVVADLLRRQVKSYRQLPVMLYQMQTKFRDEPRARGGLMRVREFVMKDGYSCHASFEDLDRYYPRVYQSYFNIFRRSGIDVISVLADVGMMGGTMAHEFMFLTDAGEDQLMLCDNCGYSANRQIATFLKPDPVQDQLEALTEIETPNTQTIAALASLLGIPASQTAKAAFFMVDDRFVFAVVRGDMEVNETKLLNAVGGRELRQARSEELATAGIVAGYASPIGITGVTVVVDDLIPRAPNLVAGANRPGFHLSNTNFPRDYRADVVADIAAAYEGCPCPRCGDHVRMVRGVEVGNTFKLGTKYSKGLGATFLDENGQEQHIVMGSYGIGVGRLIACIAEACRDSRGLIWPVTVSPFDVYLVGLDLDDQTIESSTEALYADLRRNGLEVLYDDRRERAGVKFNDADLMGFPLRVTLSRRTMAQGSVEIKVRTSQDAQIVARDDAVGAIASLLKELQDAISSRLTAEELVA